MTLEGSLVVVHHEDDRCFIPREVKDVIYRVIGLFPPKEVYYTPRNQFEPPSNSQGTIFYGDLGKPIYFTGCYTLPDACIATQIRLLNNETQNRNILVTDAAFPDYYINQTIRELQEDGINVTKLRSAQLK